MNQIPETYKKPIDMIRTPKPEVEGDELKIYAVKNRDWFDITDSLLTPELLDQIDALEVAVGENDLELIDHENRITSLEEAEPEGISESSGTWTPTLVALGSNPTVTYVAQTGRWIKQGSLVFFRIGIQWSAVSGGSGGLRIPLPVSQPGFDNAPGSGASINRVSGLSFTGQMVFSIGTTHININSMQEDNTYGTVEVLDMDTAGTIYISGTYELSDAV